MPRTFVVVSSWHIIMDRDLLACLQPVVYNTIPFGALKKASRKNSKFSRGQLKIEPRLPTCSHVPRETQASSLLLLTSHIRYQQGSVWKYFSTRGMWFCIFCEENKTKNYVYFEGHPRRPLNLKYAIPFILFIIGILLTLLLASKCDVCVELFPVINWYFYKASYCFLLSQKWGYNLAVGTHF